MPNPTNTITLDGSNNIVVHRAGNADVCIDTADAADIRGKLEQLAPPQLALLLQIAAEQHGKLPEVFLTLLKGMATQKNVVQNASIHAHSVSIGDRIEYHIHLEEKTAPLPKKLSLDIPLLPPDAVVGRDRELHDLRQLLLTRREALLINGLGGIGKTTLAQAYAQAHWDDYQHFAWVSQSPGNPFPLDLITTKGLRENLGIPDTLTDPGDIFDEMARRLNALDAGPNLLILDNVEDNIEPFRGRLPGPPHWHVLLTSREAVEGFSPIPLDFLQPEAALALFKKHYTLPGLADAQIHELAAAVDYHTLTLEILAKTARVQRYDFARLRSALVQDARANVKINRPGSDKIERITTFLAGIFSLSRLSPDEVWLLQQFACLPSEYHAYDLLYSLIEPQAAGREAAFAETLHELGRKGWLLHDTAADTYKMHLVVAEVVKKEQLPGVEAIAGLVGNITSHLRIDQTKDNPVDKFPWIPFGKAVLAVAEKQTDLPVEDANKIALLQNELALVLRVFGDHQGAKALLEKALRSDEQNFGPHHPTTAVRYSDLAIVLQDLGDYQGAKNLLEKALRSDEQNFGPDHPTTAVSYSNLATVLQDLGDYQGAKNLLEKAMRSAEQNFGPDHPTTAVSYSNLATVLQGLVDYQGAKNLLEKAMRSAEQNFGPDHPSTAVRYSNLATVLQGLGDYQGAKNLLEKAMRSAEQNFGPDHPSTARTCSNLATVLQGLGDYQGAKNLLEKAMRSDEQNFGPDHPTTAVRYSNLATVLQDLGDYQGAKNLLEKAMRSDEQNFGPDHPTTAVRYSNLALVLKDLGDYQGALELSGKAVSIFEKSLPPGHPYIAKAQKIFDSIKQQIQ